MAGDMVRVMERLGHARFAVAGHDRGARVAYRMALDHPERVARVAVLDIVPTADVWEHADARLALDYWPWSLLAQPAPLPERLLGAAPDAVVDDALGGWGSPPAPSARGARGLRRGAARPRARPRHLRGVPRRGTLDREHDEADRAAGRRVACPLLALWGDAGPSPPGTRMPAARWRCGASGPARSGAGVRAGHFFPEEIPAETAELLGRFFAPA